MSVSELIAEKAERDESLTRHELMIVVLEELLIDPGPDITEDDLFGIVNVILKENESVFDFVRRTKNDETMKVKRSGIKSNLCNKLIKIKNK